MGSKAYEEGFKSCLYSDYVNPYPEDSSEFDDYERGRTQKLKRSGSNSSFSGSFYLWESDIEPVRDLEYKPKKSSLEPQKPNPYAQAKGK